MKILFSIPAMNRGGGAQNQIRLIAKNLKSRGHDIRVLVFYKKGFLDGDNYILELEENGVQVDYLLDNFSKNPFLLLRSSIKYLGKYNPDVVVSFLYHSIALMRIASLFTNIPIHISSFRNAKIDTNFRGLFMKYTDFLSDCMVNNSNNYKLKVSKPYKNYVILNAIDDKYYGERIPSNEVRKLGENNFKWITVGRLEPQKNYPMLLNAFIGVVEKYPNTILKIFGEGRLKSELETLSKINGIENNVEFCGLTKDILNEYKKSDAFVTSSSWEGFSNALMEACAIGLPSISTNVSGAAEMISDEKNGYIVPIDEVDKLKEAMLTMMEKSSKELQEFSDMSKKRIIGICDPHIITDKWEKLMKDLVILKQNNKKQFSLKHSLLLCIGVLI